MLTPKAIILQALLAVSMLMFLSIDAAAWPFKTDNGYATCVTVDHDGNVIAAGSFSGVGPTYDVFKLSGRDSSVIWRYHVDSGTPTKVVVDPNGDVIVGGGGLIKLSGATGALLWTRNALTRDTTDLKIDQQGNIIAAGTGSFRVTKIDTNGYLVWDYLPQQGWKDCEPVLSDDSANALALDQEGNVFAVGTWGQAFSIVKLSGGNGYPMLPMKNIEGIGLCSPFDVAKAVGVDSAGNVMVAGEIYDFGGYEYPTMDFAVMKFAGNSLEQLWDQRLDGTEHGWDHASALAVDSAGDVVVAGSLDNVHLDIFGEPFQQGQQFTLVKFAGASGDVIWNEGANTDDEPPFANGAATSVVLNRNGNVIATGNYSGSFTVVKKFAASGKNWWRHEDPDKPTSTDLNMRGNEVTLDGENNVLVAGQTQIALGAPLRFTVLKLGRLSGETLNGASNTIADLAPLVYLYSDDSYRPGNPADYISHCSLNWSHAGSCANDMVAEIDSIRPSRLGIGQGEGNLHNPYSHNPVSANSTCTLYRKATFKASDHTRPYDSDREDDPANIHSELWHNRFYEREGFYLDLNDSDASLRNGIPSDPGEHLYPGAPVFYEYKAHQYVTYWFFYPYDEFKDLPGLPDIPVQKHEGDWERISIQLDGEDEPVNVLYYAHDDDRQPTDWHGVDKYEKTHVIVFSARGSHASYFAAGDYERRCYIVPFYPYQLCAYDRADYGPAWLTWNNLAQVEAQVWYGYGGAWGAVVEDDLCFPIGGCISGKDFTGPLGPSRYKTSEEYWNQHPYQGKASARSGTPLKVDIFEGAQRIDFGMKP